VRHSEDGNQMIIEKRCKQDHACDNNVVQVCMFVMQQCIVLPNLLFALLVDFFKIHLATV